MKEFKLIIKAKKNLVFQEGFASFIRGIQATKTVTINYTNGSGQTLVANQVLRTVGISGQVGFEEVKVSSNYTLTDAGSINLDITQYPISNKPNNTINFNIDGSLVGINCTYNSLPVGSNIEIEIGNRTTRIIKPSDILPHVTDFDGDSITEYALFGDVSGYEFNAIPYVAGMFMTMIDINNNKFRYVSLDQDADYEKINTYKVKDNNGNTSV